jgi:hypothetical protein
MWSSSSTGDRKSPHEAIRAFLRDIPNTHYFSDADQERMGLACSEVIGWNTIMRRNIALYAAIRSRAHIIVTVDDDNIPVSRNYFDEYRRMDCRLRRTTDLSTWVSCWSRKSTIVAFPTIDGAFPQR